MLKVGVKSNLGNPILVALEGSFECWVSNVSIVLRLCAGAHDLGLVRHGGEGVVGHRHLREGTFHLI